MHRSISFSHTQSSDWTNVTTHLNQHILCNVGTGWFSLGCSRVGNWPFWSHCNFLFGLVWVNVVGAIHATYYLLSSCPFACSTT